MPDYDETFDTLGGGSGYDEAFEEFAAEAGPVDPSERLERALAEQSRLGAQRKDARTKKQLAAFDRLLRRGAQQGAGLAAGSDALRPLAGTEYLFERLDPRHRAGFLFGVFREIYTYKCPPEPFLVWLRELGEWQQIDLLRDQFRREGYSEAFDMLARTPSDVLRYLKGVAYLDGRRRKSKRVEIRGSMVYRHDGSLFDTSALSTVFSGAGWGIFVESADGAFYSSSHALGRFHHSSFLSGAAVRSAGEWKVEAGRIRLISGKSGHYKPGVRELARLLRALQDRGALAMARVIVYGPSGAEAADYDTVGVQAERGLAIQAFLQEPDRWQTFPPPP